MRMKVMLSDPVVTVTGWTHDLDQIGEYTLRTRKTPEEVKREKELFKDKYPMRKPVVRQYRETRKTVIHIDEGEQRVATFLPGLWPRVEAELKARGITYDVEDKRNKAIRPPLDYSAFKGLEFRENQDVAVALISKCDCGIIETATAFGKSLLLSYLCKAYPTLNIVVTTSSQQVVATVYERIKQLIPGEVGVLYAGHDTTQGKRVVVTTLKSLPNIKPDNVHLVFVDECHSIGDTQAARDLMKFCWARKFGFSATPVRNDGSAIVMESLLGPTILKMTYQEAADAEMVTPMSYTMLPCPKAPNPAYNMALPDVMKRKWSYWRNSYRNKIIQRFVLELMQVYKGQILIMVSTTEHAVALNQLLPLFKVAYYGQTNFDDLKRKFPAEKFPGLDIDKYKLPKKQLDIMRRAFEKGTLRYVIATKTWKQGCDFKHLACIIRADGDVSEIECVQIPGRAARLDDNKDNAYLVDINDTFSPWALARTKGREAQYAEQKWKCVTYKDVIDGLCKQAESGDGETAE